MPAALGIALQQTMVPIADLDAPGMFLMKDEQLETEETEGQQ